MDVGCSQTVEAFTCKDRYKFGLKLSTEYFYDQDALSIYILTADYYSRCFYFVLIFCY